MLKLAITLLGLTLTLGSAQAQSNPDTLVFPLKTECAPVAEVNEFLEEYGELPFSVSESVVNSTNGEYYEGYLVIYVNPKTRSTTTVIQFPQDGMACIISMGSNFGPVNRGTAI